MPTHGQSKVVIQRIGGRPFSFIFSPYSKAADVFQTDSLPILAFVDLGL